MSAQDHFAPEAAVPKLSNRAQSGLAPHAREMITCSPVWTFTAVSKLSDFILRMKIIRLDIGGDYEVVVLHMDGFVLSCLYKIYIYIPRYLP